MCKVDTGLNAADMLTKNVGVGILKNLQGPSRNGVEWLESYIKVVDVAGRGIVRYKCCNITCILI